MIEKSKPQRTQAEIESDIRKSVAEAQKAEAEAAKLRLEISHMEAAEQRQIDLHDIAVRNSTLVMQHTEMNIESTRIMINDQKRKEQALLADDVYNQVYIFDSAVNKQSVDTCRTTLTQWMRNKPNCDIEIVFDSPGGSVFDGMHLWDFIHYLRHRGHKITTVALGHAASMAGILLQAGDVRVMGRESYVLIHEISAGAVGKVSEMDDEVAFCKKMQERVLTIFAERSAATLIERGNKTPLTELVRKQRDLVRKNWSRKDWWLDSDECFKFGFVDELR